MSDKRKMVIDTVMSGINQQLISLNQSERGVILEGLKECYEMGVDSTGYINDSIFVIIRTYSAGVHFGWLKTKQYTPAGTIVKLSEAQRVYFWSGAASLSQMAVEGVKNPEDCKFSVAVTEIELNAIEIIQVSGLAKENLLNVPIWKV